MRQRTEKTDYNNNMEKTDNEMEQIQKGLEHFLESEVDGMELREGPEEEVEPEEEEIEPGEERAGEVKKEILFKRGFFDEKGKKGSGRTGGQKEEGRRENETFWPEKIPCISCRCDCVVFRGTVYCRWSRI